jgi:hypothetical protein
MVVDSIFFCNLGRDGTSKEFEVPFPVLNILKLPLITILCAARGAVKKVLRNPPPGGKGPLRPNPVLLMPGFFPLKQGFERDGGFVLNCTPFIETIIPLEELKTWRH